MVSKEYFLLFKTADAEKRAWKNLDHNRREAIFPIVELSRGRKIRGKGKDKAGNNLTAERLIGEKDIYAFDKNFTSAFDLMSKCKNFFVDLTREPSLSCYEIEQLSDSSNGYQNWVQFVLDRKANYSSILPTLVVNPSEEEAVEEYLDNLSSQFIKFSKKFNAIAYRASILEDEDFLYDLHALKNKIEQFQRDGGEFYLFLDHEYIRPNNGDAHYQRTSQIISSILDEFPSLKIVILATSFPKSVTDIGDENHDIFRVEEMYLYKKIKKNYDEVIYGDYGSINPIRNDEVVMARGWRPRIDFTSSVGELAVYYFREKRDVIGQSTVNVRGQSKKKNIYAPYSKHYSSVANKVIGFKFGYQDLKSSWGNDGIKAASMGRVPSNSPSYWISVRMEIHIIQILKCLGLDPLD